MKPLAIGKLVRRVLLYIGLALAFLAAASLILALSIWTGITIRRQWIALAMWTAIVFGVVARNRKQQWDRMTFWLALAGLLMIHLLAYVAVLNTYPQWRLVWFALVSMVEAPLLHSVLDFVCGPPSERRYRR